VADYPISPKEHGVEFLMDNRHLWLRSSQQWAIMRVRSTIKRAIIDFLDNNGFLNIDTPIITPSAAEGTSTLFEVDFFEEKAYLAQTGQLYNEANIMAFGKVYCFGPTFRAEKSKTRRHLAEFWMVEPEIAFADLDDLADRAEDFLKYIFRAVLAECPDDMAFFAQRIEPTAVSRLEAILDMPFVRVDYAEAVEILQASGREFEFPAQWGLDLQTEHERYLTEVHFQAPVVVKNYPIEIKAFYMRVNEDGRSVAAMDVLAPGIGEIIGGSQREERLEVLERRMNDMGLDKETYDWYLDFRRYGSVPHAGFGLGFERLVSYLTGMANIRDVIPYPRVPGRADF
jgi:asparaginyl-tRNA synthetase